jgi:hypothetical protein
MLPSAVFACQAGSTKVNRILCAGFTAILFMRPAMHDPTAIHTSEERAVRGGFGL